MLGLVLFLAVLSGLPSTAASQSSRKTLEHWKEMDDEARDLLLERKYRAAQRKIDSIIDRMMEQLGPGTVGEYALGIVLMHRALAEAGLGHHDAALWDWDVALQLNPALERMDLTPFGPAGRVLAEAPPRPESSATDSLLMSCNDPRFQPPERRLSPKPEFPRGARYFGVSGPIAVQVIITKEGHPSRPVVLQDLDAATITYAALEALRKWRFRPARLEGKPVAAYYNLKLNYRLRR